MQSLTGCYKGNRHGLNGLGLKGLMSKIWSDRHTSPLNPLSSPNRAWQAQLRGPFMQAWVPPSRAVCWRTHAFRCRASPNRAVQALISHHPRSDGMGSTHRVDDDDGSTRSGGTDGSSHSDDSSKDDSRTKLRLELRCRLRLRRERLASRRFSLRFA